jgi:channel protein (hemolysin III family)
MHSWTTYSIPGFSDPVSSLTHLLGAGVFGVLTVFLLRRGWGHRGRVIALGTFALSCLFLLSMSGVYHLLSPGTSGRRVLQRLDHAAIFVLIAGTFTPPLGLLFAGLARWSQLLLIWSAAIAGISLKTIFFSSVPEWLGVTLFVSLGWIGLVPGLVIWRQYGSTFVRPLVRGAGAYTIGALLEFLHWPVLLPGVIGPHELFHVLVLTGLGFHWHFISQFADGRPSGTPLA